EKKSRAYNSASMNEDPKYKVDFGRIARTLIYEDSQGALCFCFDIDPLKDPSTGKWTLLLGSQALSADGSEVIRPRSPSEHIWIKTAFERTWQFAVSCGYNVELSKG